MTQDTQKFVVADPRGFDGDPYEVAERTFKQAEAIAVILDKCLSDARVMARNAEMSRQLDIGEAADAAEFEDTALAQQIDKNRDSVQRVSKALAILGKAASFNPKAKIGRE